MAGVDSTEATEAELSLADSGLNGLDGFTGDAERWSTSLGMCRKSSLAASALSATRMADYLVLGACASLV